MHSREGQQNFHAHAGTLHGIADSYDSVPMSHMSWSGPTAVDTHPFAMDGSNSWAPNPSLETMLEQYLSRSSLESVPSPPLSVKTLMSDLPDMAQPAELRPSLSRTSFPNCSGRSDITDSPFSMPDGTCYPQSPYDTDSHSYSESPFADEMDSSMRRGSFHNGVVNGIMRQPGRLLPATTGSSYPNLTSPEEVMLTSPMDLTAGPMFETSASRNDFSSPHDPINTNPPWTWENAIDQGDSRVSTPFSDGLWPALPVTKSPTEFPSSPIGLSPRINRRATAPQSTRIPEDSTAAYRRASHGSRAYESVPALDRSHSRGSNEAENSPRDHWLYQISSPGPDGLYHCPWEGKDPNCSHKAEKLKCNYDKFVDSHLKPYRCKVQACENARFSSTACLLRHEREAHAMHGHGEKPFLCTFEGCERGTPGNGFPRHWNLCDHMKRVHNRSPSPPSSAKAHARSKKRKNGSSEAGPSKKSIATAEQPPALAHTSSLDEEFQQQQQRLLSLLGTPDIDTMSAIQIMAKTSQQLKSSVPKMERTDSE